MTRRILVLDTNLIILLVVGSVGIKHLKAHRAITNRFLKGDYEVLQNALQRSAGVRVSPHSLAEASNLLRQIADPYRTEIGRAFQAMIRNMEEVYVISAKAAGRSEFLRFGLADMVALELLGDDAILFSTDGRLCNEARVARKTAITFAQYREEYLAQGNEL